MALISKRKTPGPVLRETPKRRDKHYIFRPSLHTFSCVLSNFHFAPGLQTMQPGLLSGINLFPPRGWIQLALPPSRTPLPRNVHLNMILVLQRTCHQPIPKHSSSQRPEQKLGFCPCQCPLHTWYIPSVISPANSASWNSSFLRPDLIVSNTVKATTTTAWFLQSSTNSLAFLPPLNPFSMPLKNENQAVIPLPKIFQKIPAVLWLKTQLPNKVCLEQRLPSSVQKVQGMAVGLGKQNMSGSYVCTTMWTTTSYYYSKKNNVHQYVLAVCVCVCVHLDIDIGRWQIVTIKIFPLSNGFI